jgi:hypothetical protein
MQAAVAGAIADLLRGNPKTSDFASHALPGPKSAHPGDPTNPAI